jgi:hypothetical protein
MIGSISVRIPDTKEMSQRNMALIIILITVENITLPQPLQFLRANSLNIEEPMEVGVSSASLQIAPYKSRD